MAVIETIVDGLRKAEKELLAQLAGVRAALGSLASDNRAARSDAPASKDAAPVAVKAVRGRRRMSAKGRKAISDAQKARWAKIKAAKKGGRKKGQDAGHG